MKNSHGRRKRFAAKLTVALLCAGMLLGSRGMPAFAGKADLYCSQSAKDALGDEQLQDLVDLIVMDQGIRTELTSTRMYCPVPMHMFPEIRSLKKVKVSSNT